MKTKNSGHAARGEVRVCKEENKVKMKEFRKETLYCGERNELRHLSLLFTLIARFPDTAKNLNTYCTKQQG